MSATVGIVIPALRPNLEALASYIDRIQEVVDPTTIRVEIDDPRVDRRQLDQMLHAEVGVSPTRRGKGLAITAGFEALNTDILSFVDADGSTKASSIAQLIDGIASGDADVMVGSRHHPDAAIISQPPLLRRSMSLAFISLARMTTGIGISDFQCGAKAIERQCWTAIRDDLYEPGFAWDLEMLWLADHHGCVIRDRPIDWEDRPDSTVPPFRTALELGSLLTKLALGRHPGTGESDRPPGSLIDRLDAASLS